MDRPWALRGAPSHKGALFQGNLQLGRLPHVLLFDPGSCAPSLQDLVLSALVFVEWYIVYGSHHAQTLARSSPAILGNCVSAAKKQDPYGRGDKLDYKKMQRAGQQSIKPGPPAIILFTMWCCPACKVPVLLNYLRSIPSERKQSRHRPVIFSHDRVARDH